MKEIIEQYGGTILTFIVILALIAIVGLLLTGEGSPVADAFSELINNLKNAPSTEIP